MNGASPRVVAWSAAGRTPAAAREPTYSASVTMAQPEEAPVTPVLRTKVFRDSMGVAVTTAAYAVSFGAISVASGLNVWQTMALSLVMFSGASQFAMVGVIAGGGSPWAGAATAILLGARNAFYGLRLSSILGVRGWRRAVTAQFVIDESTAMSINRPTSRERRIGFYATGLGIFCCWNLGTLLGAVGAGAIADPRVFGLDAASPAAFIALLAPRLRGREPWAVALGAAALAVLATPLTPPGVPVLVAAAFGIAVGAWPHKTDAASASSNATTDKQLAGDADMASHGTLSHDMAAPALPPDLVPPANDNGESPDSSHHTGTDTA